jgi:hypothetical protein
MPQIATHRRMLHVFEPINESNGAGALSADQFVTVLKANSY